MLVPELAGAAADEVAELRAAMVAAAAALPARWIAITVGVTDDLLDADSVGTFAGFGADVTVRLSPDAAGAPVAMPVGALIAGWIREQAQRDARAQVRVLAHHHDASSAVEIGRRLRAEIDEDRADRSAGRRRRRQHADPGRARRSPARRRRRAKRSR